MNSDALLSALDLPASSRVDRRVPKKLLLENGAPSAPDKRIINDGIEELLWLAALKPTTVGVPEYRDDVREYLEIAVLRLNLRTTAKTSRLVELVHRAVPYPLLLLTEQGDQSGISAAHKRWSQGEAGKTVLEGDVVSAEWSTAHDTVPWSTFSDSLGLSQQPHTTLHALYQGWINTLLAFRAARVTGRFVPSSNAVHSEIRQEALKEYARLEIEIAGLRAQAKKETQINRRVEMNLKIQQLQVQLDARKQQL